MDEETWVSGDGTRHPNQAFCLCGNAWFIAEIAIEHDGHPNGYAGPLRCTGCGAEMPVGWRGAKNPNGTWFDPNDDWTEDLS